jgi:DNA-directed RNA polymerase specialized sigma subunit
MVATAVMKETCRPAESNEAMVEYFGDQQALYEMCNSIIEMHLPLVEDMADEIRNACSLNINPSDLVSAGVFGLTNALENYDSKEITFEEYCKPAVRAALLDAVRYADWMHGSDDFNSLSESELN